MTSRILAAIVLIVFAGCSHTRHYSDSKHPEIVFTEMGELTFQGKYIKLEELPGELDYVGYDKKSQIEIRVSNKMRDFKAPRRLLFILRKAGYTRGVLVTEKHAYSGAVKKQERK